MVWHSSTYWDSSPHSAVLNGTQSRIFSVMDWYSLGRNRNVCRLPCFTDSDMKPQRAKSPCDQKKFLVQEYLAALERFRSAERQFASTAGEAISEEIQDLVWSENWIRLITS